MAYRKSSRRGRGKFRRAKKRGKKRGIRLKRYTTSRGGVRL